MHSALLANIMSALDLSINVQVCHLVFKVVFSCFVAHWNFKVHPLWTSLKLALTLSIADSFRSLEQGFSAFRLGNEKFLTEKENFDLKEKGKLKYSRFKLC